MADDERDDGPAPEAPVRMQTKGKGWSGRDQPDEDGGGVAVKEKEKRPTPPAMGPGMEKTQQQQLRDVEVDERFEDVEDPLKEIPDDAGVDADALVRDSKIHDILERMDRELVALNVVKARVRELSALLLIDRLRRQLKLEAEVPTLHMTFTGNPGTGKTTVASKMGEILFKLGYVRKGHLVSASRDDLVGQYVGHTAPKTREVLKRAMGGVLFIDEAYMIYRLDNERDYGQETVEMLLQVMENNRQDIVVIFAGYKDRMERFFNDVPGLSSRVAHHLHFPDYELEELLEIGQLMLDQWHYRLSDDGEKAFKEYMEKRMKQPRFANGRSVRNALERARMRQAVRLFNAAEDGRKLTKLDLVTIEAEDIYKSRVFEQDAEGIRLGD